MIEECECEWTQENHERLRDLLYAVNGRRLAQEERTELAQLMDQVEAYYDEYFMLTIDELSKYT